MAAKLCLQTLPTWGGSLDDCKQVAVLLVAVVHPPTLASLCVILSSRQAPTLVLREVEEACWHGLFQPSPVRSMTFAAPAEVRPMSHLSHLCLIVLMSDQAMETQVA